MIKVEMLSTGDEVLYGQIVDTNAAWLADYLFTQGLPMSRRNTVGDNLDSLVAILRERSQQADVLIVNGGLGPTSDDLSAQAAACAAGEALVEHAGWLVHMERFFAERGRVMAPSNRKQAQIPASSEMINNPAGTACGFMLRLGRCRLFFTPGVPVEFRAMIDQEIMPRLQREFALGEPPICLRLTTFGRSESELAQQLDGMALPPGVVLGYRSSMPIIELKLTGPASERAAMESLWQTVRQVAGESTVFEGTQGLPAQLAHRLRDNAQRLTLSEQFTAGLVAFQLTGAGAPLGDSEILACREETLEEVAGRARTLATRHGSLALLVGGMHDRRLALALATPEAVYALAVQFSVNRHDLETRQQVCAMMALNMVRRWLNGWPIAVEHGWVNVVDSLTLPA